MEKKAREKKELGKWLRNHVREMVEEAYTKLFRGDYEAVTYMGEKLKAEMYKDNHLEFTKWRDTERGLTIAMSLIAMEELAAFRADGRVTDEEVSAGLQSIQFKNFPHFSQITHTIYKSGGDVDNRMSFVDSFSNMTIDVLLQIAMAGICMVREYGNSKAK